MAIIRSEMGSFKFLYLEIRAALKGNEQLRQGRETGKWNTWFERRADGGFFLPPDAILRSSGGTEGGKKSTGTGNAWQGHGKEGEKKLF